MSYVGRVLNDLGRADPSPVSAWCLGWRGLMLVGLSRGGSTDLNPAITQLRRASKVKYSLPLSVDGKLVSDPRIATTPGSKQERIHTRFFKEREVADVDLDKGWLSVNAMLNAAAQLFCGDNSQPAGALDREPVSVVTDSNAGAVADYWD
jgi:hypothetical protein